MKIRDYYFGVPVTLRSPLRPEEIKDRIKAATKVRWWKIPFRNGPAGGVRWGKLRLRRASFPIEYNAKPMLIGPIERTMTGSVMRLVYRGDTWSRIFFVLWYLFLALFVMVFSIVGFDPPLHGAERLMPVGFLLVMALVPIGMHLIGTRRSEEDLVELIAFLERVAEAKRSPDL